MLTKICRDAYYENTRKCALANIGKVRDKMHLNKYVGDLE